jgi:tetratricopeptide (TPR) repeat protein
MSNASTNVERAIELQGQAWNFQAEGKLDDAQLTCSAALRLMEESEGPDSPDLANLLNDLADIETDRQNFPAAFAAAERAQAIANRLGDGFSGEDAVRIRVKTLELLGTIRRTLGDYARAEVDLRSALAVAAAAFGEASSEAAEARNNLGVLYKHCGRFDEGLQLYRQALGSTAEESLARGTIYHNIGGILHAQGDFAAAEEPAGQAWGISRRLLGEDDPRTMVDAAAYAGILDGLGRHEESERIYRSALEIFEKTFGPRHYEVAANLHNLAASLAARGMFQEAEEYYRRALAIKEELLGADSPDAALTRHNLGNLLSQTGRFAEAVLLLENAVAILENRLRPEHPHLILARENLQTAVRSLRASGSPTASRRTSG